MGIKQDPHCLKKLLMKMEYITNGCTPPEIFPYPGNFLENIPYPPPWIFYPCDETVKRGKNLEAKKIGSDF